ncbi:hypothetical protein C8Q79DRAFT_929996 [Trametes meyenii]|nr:hypothetical protein C8Q79DRAFT_929996 [Trametes meyenii]
MLHLRAIVTLALIGLVKISAAVPPVLHLDLEISMPAVEDVNLHAQVIATTHNANVGDTNLVGLHAQGPQDADLLLPTFIGCTADMKDDITAAIAAAKEDVENAVEAIGAPAPNPRYQRWFGAFEAARRLTVQRCYHAISPGGVTSFDAWTYQCGPPPAGGPQCTEDRIAFVNPAIPNVIRLCDPFWDLPPTTPVTGAQSMAGVLIREATKFSVTCHTQDIASSHAACEQLAKTSPAQAVTNADSYEYFATIGNLQIDSGRHRIY